MGNRVSRGFQPLEIQTLAGPGESLSLDKVVSNNFKGRKVFYEGLRKADPVVWNQLLGILGNLNPLVNNMQSTTDAIIADIRKSQALHGDQFDPNKVNDLLTEQVHLKHTHTVGGADEKYPIFQKYLDAVTKDEEGNLPESYNNLDIKLADDPKANLELLELTMNDRYIFIAVTLIIRMVTMFLIQWSINSEMILNYQQAFIQYILIYCMMILFLTFVVSTNDIGMQQLLYYMDTNTHGYSRILLHIFLVIILIPILYVIKLPNSTNTQTNVSYEYKQQIITSISIFSWVVWLFTSLVALRF
jgi:hypothetical protein